MNRLTIVLLLLAVGLGLLLINHDGGRTLGIDGVDGKAAQDAGRIVEGRVGLLQHRGDEARALDAAPFGDFAEEAPVQPLEPDATPAAAGHDDTEFGCVLIALDNRFEVGWRLDHGLGTVLSAHASPRRGPC